MKNFIKYPYELFLVLIVSCLFILPGCASMGASPAQSFSEQLAYGYGGVSALRTTCYQLLAAQTMALPTAQRCLADTDAARAGLDAAYAASAGGDQSTAVAKLNAATVILTELQTFLNTKGK